MKFKTHRYFLCNSNNEKILDLELVINQFQVTCVSVTILKSDAKLPESLYEASLDYINLFLLKNSQCPLPSSPDFDKLIISELGASKKMLNRGRMDSFSFWQVRCLIHCHMLTEDGFYLTIAKPEMFVFFTGTPEFGRILQDSPVDYNKAKSMATEANERVALFKKENNL